MWAAHQVHHSSEDYNLSTALRQSILQRYCTWVRPFTLFIIRSGFLLFSVAKGLTDSSVQFTLLVEVSHVTMLQKTVITQLKTNDFYYKPCSHLPSNKPFLSTRLFDPLMLFIGVGVNKAFKISDVRSNLFYVEYCSFLRCSTYLWHCSLQSQLLWFIFSSTSSTSSGFTQRSVELLPKAALGFHIITVLQML